MEESKMSYRSYLLECLNELFIEEGGEVTKRKVIDSEITPHYYHYRKEFGGLAPAFKELNQRLEDCEVSYDSRNWNKRRVMKGLLWFIRINNRLPTVKDIKKDSSLPGRYEVVLKYVGRDWKKESRVVKELIKAKQRLLEKAGNINCKGVNLEEDRWKVMDKTGDEADYLGRYKSLEEANKVKLNYDIKKLEGLLNE